MEEMQTVPIVVYESLSSRLCRIIRWILTGWALSMVAMGLVVVISLSYSEEVMTDSVIQEADDYGYNAYTGGDYYGGETNSSENDSQANARIGNIYQEA